MYRYPIAKHRVAAAFLAALALLPTAPAFADGEIIITHAKALAGNVTPGDTAGYPVTISTVGTFRLASNLIVPANQAGILIKRSLVTIDLNGFTMLGSGAATYGIQGSLNSATIRNGTITGFKLDGIYGDPGAYWVVENMRIVANGRDGILAADGARVRGSTISANGRRGVVCDDDCLIESSTVTHNKHTGVHCGGLSCHAEGNLVSFNSGIGIYLYDGFVLGNTISRNGGFGIDSGSNIPTVYGNNTLTGNNQGNAQAHNVVSLHANYCYPGACP